MTLNSDNKQCSTTTNTLTTPNGKVERQFPTSTCAHTITAYIHYAMSLPLLCCNAEEEDITASAHGDVAADDSNMDLDANADAAEGDEEGELIDEPEDDPALSEPMTKQDMRDMEAQYPSRAHLVSELYQDRTHQIHIRMICEGARPLFHEYLQDMAVEQKGQEEQAHWAAQRSLGKWHLCCVTTCQMIHAKRQCQPAVASSGDFCKT